VGERSCTGDDETDDGGDDGREGRRRDERQEQVPADGYRELRCRQVAGRVRLGDLVAADDQHCPIANDRRHHEEAADDPRGGDDGIAGGLGVGDGQEADEDVGQSADPEDRRHAQRHQAQGGERRRRRWRERLAADLRSDPVEHRDETEVEPQQQG